MIISWLDLSDEIQEHSFDGSDNVELTITDEYLASIALEVYAKTVQEHGDWSKIAARTLELAHKLRAGNHKITEV